MIEVFYKTVLSMEILMGHAQKATTLLNYRGVVA